MTQPDVPTFAKELLTSLATGTSIAGVPIDRGRLAASRVPPAILLEEAGALSNLYAPIFDPFRVQVTVYGESEGDAADMLRTISSLLTDQRNLIRSEVGLWFITDETGPLPGQDGNTDWPTRTSVFGFRMPSVLLAEAS